MDRQLDVTAHAEVPVWQGCDLTCSLAMQYMDRVYVKHQNKAPVHQLGLDLWRDLVLHLPRIRRCVLGPAADFCSTSTEQGRLAGCLTLQHCFHACCKTGSDRQILSVVSCKPCNSYTAISSSASGT